MKLTLLFLLGTFPFFAQLNLPSALKVDTHYTKIQCYSNEALNTLSNHFENVSKEIGRAHV